MMYYSFVLKKPFKSSQEILRSFKEKVPNSLILKVEPLPSSSIFSFGYRDLVVSLKETIRSMYSSSQFVSVEVNELSDNQCHVWRITLRCLSEDIRAIEKIELIQSISTQNIPYQYQPKEMMEMGEIIIQDDRHSYFSNLRFNQVFLDQSTNWTYFNDTIIISIVFTFKVAHRISLLMCVPYHNITIKYYDRNQTMHFLIHPSCKPSFYYTQIPLNHYISPLILPHYSFPNIFYPDKNEEIFFRLIVRKSGFEQLACRQFCSRLKQMKKQNENILTFERVEYMESTLDRFNYQHHYQKQKKEPQPQETTVYVINDGELKHHLSNNKLIWGHCPMLIISKSNTPSVIPNVIGKEYETFVNEKGVLRINTANKNKLNKREDYQQYKLIRESMNRTNSKLFLIKSSDFNAFDIDWENRRESQLGISELIMPLDDIDCSRCKLTDFSNSSISLNPKNSFSNFLGFIHSDTLCKNKVYLDDVVVYAQFQNKKGFLMCIKSQQKFDLQLSTHQRFNNEGGKLKVIQIQSQHTICLTDADLAEFVKVISLSELIRAQQQTMQSLLYCIEQYFQNNLTHPLLNLIAPITLFSHAKITYHFKEAIVSKFQRLKQNLPFGVSIHPLYTTQQSHIESSFKGKYLYIYFNRKIIKLPQKDSRFHQQNTTSYVILPLRYKSVFQDQKIVLINNQFLIQKLSSVKQGIPGMEYFIEHSDLPYSYNYGRFVEETLAEAEFKSLFKTNIQIRNPYLPSKIVNIQSISSQNEINKLIGQRLEMSGHVSDIYLIIDHQNASDLFLLWKTYKHYLKRKFIVHSDLKGELEKCKTKYEEIHHLFLVTH